MLEFETFKIKTSRSEGPSTEPRSFLSVLKNSFHIPTLRLESYKSEIQKCTVRIKKVVVVKTKVCGNNEYVMPRTLLFAFSREKAMQNGLELIQGN